MNDCGKSSPGTEKTAGSSLTVPLRNSSRHSPITIAYRGLPEWSRLNYSITSPNVESIDARISSMMRSVPFFLNSLFITRLDKEGSVPIIPSLFPVIYRHTPNLAPTQEVVL